MVSLVTFSVFRGSIEIFSYEGIIGFLTGTDWNAVEGRESFGALPYIVGTLASSAIVMVIGVPISLGIATSYLKCHHHVSPPDLVRNRIISYRPKYHLRALGTVCL